jgi:hypothetical protein
VFKLNYGKTIPPIFIKQTITSHLILLSIKKGVGNPGPGLRPAQKCGGVKSVCFVV